MDLNLTTKEAEEIIGRYINGEWAHFNGACKVVIVRPMLSLVDLLTSIAYQTRELDLKRDKITAIRIVRQTFKDTGFDISLCTCKAYVEQYLHFE